MHTSQTGAFATVLYVVFLVVCLRALYSGSSEARRALARPRPVAIAVVVVVAVPSLLQLIWPQVFSVLSRQPELIVHGQIWRLLTSVTVQDSGVVGTIFNLVALAIALPVAFTVFKPAAGLALWLAGALLFNILATFVWRDAGGGSSAATFFLVAASTGLTSGRRATQARIAVGVALLAGVLLIVLRDAHGVAVLAGVVVGIASAVIHGLARRDASFLSSEAEASR